MTVQRARRTHQWAVNERKIEEARFLRRSAGSAHTLEDSFAEIDAISAQQEYELQHSLMPVTETLLDRLRSGSVVTSTAHELVWAWQRVVRGWDDRSVWNIDYYLCRHLGGQLLQLSKEAHGWPATEEFPTYEEWTEALRFHGNRLLAAATLDIPKDGDTDPSDDAQESLRWVADHLRDLWD